MCAVDNDERQRKLKLRTVTSKRAVARSRRLIKGSRERIERAAQQHAVNKQTKAGKKKSLSSPPNHAAKSKTPAKNKTLPASRKSE